jgi:7,8-dihydropterin-6-yl-methyl-4-(beta-D-ribofuranosyl)aminobenzene 5'-phosphate synthase
MNQPTSSAMKILFDNYNHDSQCQSLWGFSAYFEKQKLLFDTGSNGRVLLKNMAHLNVNIEEIEYLFITHSHWDHTGGIDSILELNDQLTLIIPESLSDLLIEDLKTLVKNVIICTTESQQINEELYTTGLLGEEMPEQSLIINDDKPKVVTGCGHHGIQNIIQVAERVIDRNIDMAIGGFHLMESEEADVITAVAALEKLGVKTVLPTHCTGDLGIQLFKQTYQDNYIKGGVGTVVEI